MKTMTLTRAIWHVLITIAGELKSVRDANT